MEGGKTSQLANALTRSNILKDLIYMGLSLSFLPNLMIPRIGDTLRCNFSPASNLMVDVAGWRNSFSGFRTSLSSVEFSKFLRCHVPPILVPNIFFHPLLPCV